MKYCKYHPLKSASFYCPDCNTYNCGQCINEVNNKPSCFICRKKLQWIDSQANITPFWRRWQETFNYPMRLDSFLFIIGSGALMAFVRYFPFSFILHLVLLGALLKYCFACLDQSANGDFEAPDLSQAYGADFMLTLQVIFMVMLMFALTWATSSYISPMLGSMIGIVMVVIFPAMIINFAMSENIIVALSPLKTIKLISSIGLPYGLLLAFIMMMIASVGIMNEFIGYQQVFSSIIRSAVSNYYMIVAFHLMGYMLYQYHNELGFDVATMEPIEFPSRLLLQNKLANIDVHLKEGLYEEVINQYQALLDAFPDESKLKANYFELILASKNQKELVKFSTVYLDYLQNTNRKDIMPVTYKRIIKAYPNYIPANPNLRLNLAKICQHRGDTKAVVKLINGLKKAHPEFKELKSAYFLMAIALDTLPNMQTQAQKARTYAISL